MAVLPMYDAKDVIITVDGIVLTQRHVFKAERPQPTQQNRHQRRRDQALARRAHRNPIT